MPMTVCLVVMSRYVPKLRFIHVLLADQPPLTPSERIYQRLLAFDYNELLKVVRAQLKTMPLVSLFDDVLIPSLVLAERDRHTGVLNAEQEEFVQEAAADLVDELSDPALVINTANAVTDTVAGRELEVSDTDPRDARVLCVALRDRADELASQMLAQLLAVEGYQVDTDAPEALTSEVVEHVAKLASDVVVISILPPIAPRDTRLLWKRLRSRFPELPIIVGFWSGGAVIESLVPPEHDPGTRVVTKLSEAVELVRVMAAQRRIADQAAEQEHRIAAG
jgi:hypothetical protein